MEKQDVEMERLRVTNEELTLELQQVYYSFHKPGVDTFQGWDSTTQATEASLDAMLEAGGAGGGAARGRLSQLHCDKASERPASRRPQSAILRTRKRTKTTAELSRRRLG